MFSRQEEVYGLQGVQCNGTEYMLSECQNSTTITDECLNGSHVAGVRCVEGKSITEMLAGIKFSSLASYGLYKTVNVGGFKFGSSVQDCHMSKEF